MEEKGDDDDGIDEAFKVEAKASLENFLSVILPKEGGGCSEISHTERWKRVRGSCGDDRRVRNQCGMDRFDNFLRREVRGGDC